MPRYVVEKKVPFRHAPKARYFVIVKADHVSGDDIELSAEIGKWNKALHTPDQARHAEQLGHFPEHRKVIRVETEDVVPKQAAEVKKISGPATDIENSAVTAEVELEIANTSQVRLEPRLPVEIFRRIVPGVIDLVTSANCFELLAVGRLRNGLRVEIGGQSALQQQSALMM